MRQGIPYCDVKAGTKQTFASRMRNTAPQGLREEWDTI
ncbi:MAG: hypothetical protein CM15mP74_08650 [Halieaceae bacterium]|nr:MAG: hypothetical protein CM15mP74_08650 [Halieaceae bacterium]